MVDAPRHGARGRRASSVTVWCGQCGEVRWFLYETRVHSWLASVVLFFCVWFSPSSAHPPGWWRPIVHLLLIVFRCFLCLSVFILIGFVRVFSTHCIIQPCGFIYKAGRNHISRVA
ncbi:hypothetical protein VPH35_083757 [Triticum aestivum]